MSEEIEYFKEEIPPAIKLKKNERAIITWRVGFDDVGITDIERTERYKESSKARKRRKK